MKICSKAHDVSQTDTYVEISTNAAPIRIYYLTDEILRIRAGFHGDFKEESYSLMLTGWEDRLDFLFKEKRTRIVPTLPTIEDQGDHILLVGNTLDVFIQKKPLAIRIFDKDKTLLHADVPELAYQLDANARRIHTSVIAEGNYLSPVEQIALDVVYPQNAPLAVLVDNQVLPHYLYDKKYAQVECSWYYNLSTKSIEIKYPAPTKDYQVKILTSALDMIGM